MTRPTERASTWVVAHAARVWGVMVIAVVLALSWQALRGIHIHTVRALLHSLDARWLLAVVAITAGSIAVMGLYDVLAFRHTRATAAERWRFGAVAFCWSNFLTLGPLAGPAIRLWLYRDAVDELGQLHGGIISIVLAFLSGLAGWTIGAYAAVRLGLGPLGLAAVALLFVVVAAWSLRAVAARFERFAGLAPAHTFELAVVGWLDWLLAMFAFAGCVFATGTATPVIVLVDQFFLGQAIGLASLVPGGFGSSDAYWIGHLPLNQNVTAAALAAYRLIYYVAPWVTASLLLLSWAARRSLRRTALARRVMAGLVGGAGVLIIISSATPALHARLVLLERFVPLPLVEAGQVAAALAGLLLLSLARGLARGYRAAFKGTLALLLLAGLASLLKGLDWEEAVTLGTVGVAAWSQSALFDRDSSSDWLESADLGLALAALLLFVVFGIFSHHLSTGVLGRWTEIGYRFQGARFLRSAASMLLAVGSVVLYIAIRTPVHFSRPPDADVNRALEFNAANGTSTTPIMVGVGDKGIFFDGDRGFCLYRTIGPYLVVFSDPVVRAAGERGAFIDALFAFSAGVDRRPLFYQISSGWIPLLHDRGYHLFKLGEEAIVPLDRVTLDGHAGKLARQVLRRAERDGLVFRVIDPYEVERRVEELRAISDHWLEAKGVVERQFSIGYFDPSYLARCRCGIVETADGVRVLAFANLLEGPRRSELSVDLMRYRTEGPSTMDFLLTSVMLYGKHQGYRAFNLGMAPLAAVGEHRGAHERERLASLIFRRGEHWYNFQGIRQYKEKFDPDWVPRYLAYEGAWEWPVALANVSALIAGGWKATVAPSREARRA